MPTDGFALKNIEEKWPIFKYEPRNVILSLAIDGFNPFGELRSTYSVWHVFVINNNLPPWMSIKREHTMLAMIIPGIFLKVIILFHFFVSLLHENIFYILGNITYYHRILLNKLGKYQVKYMNAYIEPLIDELLSLLWVGITMYDIARPIE